MPDQSANPGGITSTSTQTPLWYDQLAQQFGNTASGALSQVANLAGNWYDQPLVAGLTPEQEALIGQGGTTAGQWQPEFAQGVNTMQSALPVWGQAQTAAGNITSGLPAAQSLWGQSANMTRDAGTYDPAAMQQHLNPYVGGVLDEIARRGNQNLTQNIMPSVNQSFTGAGLFGSSRNAKFLQDAIGKTQQEILGAQASAGNQAYQNAAQDYYNWGQLGMQGANQLGNLGTTEATTPANLYTTQAGQFGNEATGIGALGQNMGQQALNGQGQAWDDLTKQYALQEQERQNTQQGLTAGYEDWQKQLTTPFNLMGALSQMTTQFPSLYRGASTTIAAPVATPTSNYNDLANLLGMLNQLPATS